MLLIFIKVMNMRSVLFSLMCASILFSAIDEASAGKNSKKSSKKSETSLDSKIEKSKSSNKTTKKEDEDQQLRNIIENIMKQRTEEREKQELLERQNRVLNPRVRKKLFSDET
jgi:flagellar biosynthesis component FlhA